MCTNLSDGNEVLEGSKRHKGIVWVGLEYRFMSPVQSLISHVDKIGNIKMLSIREHRFPFLEKVDNWNRFNENTGDIEIEGNRWGLHKNAANFVDNYHTDGDYYGTTILKGHLNLYAGKC